MAVLDEDEGTLAVSTEVQKAKSLSIQMSNREQQQRQEEEEEQQALLALSATGATAQDDKSTDEREEVAAAAATGPAAIADAATEAPAEKSKRKRQPASSSSRAPPVQGGGALDLFGEVKLAKVFELRATIFLELQCASPSHEISCCLSLFFFCSVLFCSVLLSLSALLFLHFLLMILRLAYSLALADYAKAIMSEPSRPDYFFQRSTCHRHLGRFEMVCVYCINE